jgi:hypothetical protein
MKSQVVSIHVLRGVAAFLVAVAHGIEHAMPLPAEREVDHGHHLLPGRRGALRSGVFHHSRCYVHRADLLSVHDAGLVLALVATSLFKTMIADFGHLLRSLASSHRQTRPTRRLGCMVQGGLGLVYEMFFKMAMVLLFCCRSSLQRAVLLTAGMILAHFSSGRAQAFSPSMPISTGCPSSTGSGSPSAG